MNWIKSNKWCYYIGYFFVFCIIGWIYELGWEIAGGRGFVNRGFLYGPYLPVYGVGGVLLLLCLEKLMKKKIGIGKINFTPVIVFLAILVIVSVVELIASYILEFGFGMELWNYSYDKINFQGRISLRNSTLLAIGGMCFLYIFYPLLKKLFSHINEKALRISAITIVAVMSVDFILVLLFRV